MNHGKLISHSIATAAKFEIYSPIISDSQMEKKGPNQFATNPQHKMAAEVQQAPFVKQLAANGKELLNSYRKGLISHIDRPTRDKAVASLRTFLGGRRRLEDLELLKLWKGLFFCMWMSDRPRPQQMLAADLADLVAVLPESNVLPFLTAFWKTMAREWTNIDVLRYAESVSIVETIC